MHDFLIHQWLVTHPWLQCRTSTNPLWNYEVGGPCMGFTAGEISNMLATDRLLR